MYSPLCLTIDPILASISCLFYLYPLSLSILGPPFGPPSLHFARYPKNASHFGTRLVSFQHHSPPYHRPFFFSPIYFACLLACLRIFFFCGLRCVGVWYFFPFARLFI